MKKFVGAGILLLVCIGFSAVAQDWYHDRMGRFQGEGWRMHLFERVRADLDHVQLTAWTTGKEAHRLERTKQELRDLQVKLENHRYDEHELDDVISSLRRSANDGRLPPRDRDVINDDLIRMREYRDRHEHWGR
jgi:hypothetical protein